jgi:hypothetical protein
MKKILPFILILCSIFLHGQNIQKSHYKLFFPYHVQDSLVYIHALENWHDNELYRPIDTDRIIFVRLTDKDEGVYLKIFSSAYLKHKYNREPHTQNIPSYKIKEAVMVINPTNHSIYIKE